MTNLSLLVAYTPPCTPLPYRPLHNCPSAANRSPVLLIPQKNSIVSG